MLHQSNRKSPAAKSMPAEQQTRRGSRAGGLCGTCASCTDPTGCDQCHGCSGFRSGRCAFLPCLVYDYKAATLCMFVSEAKAVRDQRLEKKFNELYGDNGVFATKLKSVSTFQVPNKQGPRGGGRCGSCSTCTDPIQCGKCSTCSGHRQGRCIFALCLTFKYAAATLTQNREEAQSIKVGDEHLERQFDLLYGRNGIFSSKRKPTDPPLDGKIRSRCGTCVSCTTTVGCHQCSGCRDKRGSGACIFRPCLKFDYKESTLSLYRQQARSIKAGNKSLEDQFERMYGEQGLLARKDQRDYNSAPSEVPAVAQASSSGISYNCSKCTSCCSPITCGICAHCRKATKCVFSLCQNRDYKGATMATYESCARQACEMRSADEKLKVRFEEIFGKGTAESAPRSGPFSCGNCVSCCSPISCNICYWCKANRRCVFDICRNFNYKESRMVSYKMWAEQALEVCEDDKLKDKLQERFNKLFTKGRAKTKRQAATTHQISIGTRVYAIWPDNNVSVDCWRAYGDYSCSNICPLQQWYYGNIVSQSKNKFDIEFDDGDVRKGVTRNEFVIKDKSAGKSKAMVTDLTNSDDENTAAAISELRNGNVEHFLLNKGYYHRWLNRDGIVKAAYGTIESCALTDGEIKFTVALDLSVGHWVAFGVRNEAPNPHMCDVEEADAWAGYISFLFQTDGKKCTYSGLNESLPPDSKPFYRHYIISTIHACAQQRAISLVVKGHHVQLKAKESKILNGGLGLFVSAKPIASLDSRRANQNTPLVLEEGELVDLGVYGPLRPEDLKLDHVLIVKNFVHNWKSENWSFEAKGHNGGLIVDITDDDTGNLSKVAENNILVYTNETNGIEIPTVFAKEDPEGAVHYYLGHSHSEQGCLSIPTDGTELELKIDYGTKYESVRLRMGYSRLSGRQLQAEKIKALTYEKDMLSELRTLTAEEIFDVQILLEKLNSQWTETSVFNSMEAVGRALLVTLVLLRQAMAISNQVEDASMHRALVQTLHELSLQFFDQFDFATNRSFIVDNNWYAELLSTTLRLRVVKSIGDNTHSIRKAIECLIK